MAQSHAIPIEESRLLHRDAYRSYVLDTLVTELKGKIDLLETEKGQIRKDFEELLRVEREKTTLQRGISDNWKDVSKVNAKESEHYKRLYNREKRLKVVAIGVGVVLLALHVIQ